VIKNDIAGAQFQYV